MAACYFFAQNQNIKEGNGAGQGRSAPKIMTTMKNIKDQLAVKVAQIADAEPSVPAVQVTEGNTAVVAAPVTATTAQPVLDVVPVFSISIEEAKARVAMLQQFVRDMMTAGVDYGVIPGCPKPTLTKSGAEKLCLVYGFSKQIEVTNRLEDWDKGLFHYEVKVTLINKRTGLIEAEGIGCCNSREKKYAKQDPYTISNTIIKIAKKRALVDSTLSATKSSWLFTQDLETVELPPPTPAKPVTAVTVVPVTPVVDEAPLDNSQQPASKAQLHQIYALAQDQNLGSSLMRTTIRNLFNAGSSTELTAMQAEALIDWLKRA